MAHVNRKPISCLLVANRGEIACRIMRTARNMGIRTVAVYADSDAQAPFVKQADTAFALAGERSAETYLDIEKIIEACKVCGADAVHPGYGFLSENAAFARAVIANNLTWIGPSPEVIEQMGDKLAAKKLMQAADVPTLPAVELTPDVSVEAAAAEFGYPVLVKASAGGGGRGMRVVEQPEDLIEAIASARREAGTSFGDDTVFLEKWLAVSRHVEIQILGDQHGNLVHCFERECSIQRRHQKIIEEAPSPAVSPALRKRMGDAALAAAHSLGYSSAGTVEFLVDGDAFYFLEVNARLQVEHPVTEEIIGHDLVREQIRVAEGETLSFKQEDLTINGWAMEARLYAENPAKNFLPTPGKVVLWEPSQAVYARYDAGIESGTVIGTQFDPMIAKVTAHAPTRREAAGRLARALETTQIHGLTTNRDFLVSTLRTTEFLEGDTTTDFIERVQPARVREPSQQEITDAVIGVGVEARARRMAQRTIHQHIPAGFRVSTLPPERVQFKYGERLIEVAYTRARDDTLQFRVDTEDSTVGVHAAGDGAVDISIGQRRVQITTMLLDDTWHIQTPSGGLKLKEIDRYPRQSSEESSGELNAPMPGTVLKVECAVGDRVKQGDLLLILEAMKMEHRISAPTSGSISALYVDKDQQVENGQLLVKLDKES